MEQVNLLGAEHMKPAEPEELLARLKDKVAVCSKCGLCQSRTQVVFGKGNSRSPQLAVVGEGPGANEDTQGEPFVGRAGQLLTKMLAAINIQREEVYIANVVMCRPPENRTPTKEEISACRPFLFEQLRIVKPRAILCLGSTASQCMMRTGKPIGELRGFWGNWEDIPVRATFHPAYLLRPQGAARKADAWTDLKLVAGKLATMRT